MLEKYKYKLTVTRVFLLVCILVILLLSYLLVVEHDKVKKQENEERVEEVVFTESDALNIIQEKYKRADEYVNNSMFINNESLGYGCVQVELNGFGNYFTERIINDVKNKLLNNGQVYYVCDTSFNLTSIFGISDVEIPEFNILIFDEEMIVATIQNKYIVLVQKHGNWLIEMYE